MFSQDRGRIPDRTKKEKQDQQVTLTNQNIRQESLIVSCQYLLLCCSFMALDENSKAKAIKTAIEILQDSKDKMNVTEMNYVVDALKDIEQQLQVEREIPTGTA